MDIQLSYLLATRSLRSVQSRVRDEKLFSNHNCTSPLSNFVSHKLILMVMQFIIPIGLFNPCMCNFAKVESSRTRASSKNLTFYCQRMYSNIICIRNEISGFRCPSCARLASSQQQYNSAYSKAQVEMRSLQKSIFT